MNEEYLKETLTKESEKSYSPVARNDISGWFDDIPTRPVLVIRTKARSICKANTVSKKKSLNTSNPIQKTKKPISLFEFFALNTHQLRYKKSTSFMKSSSRPSSSGKKTYPKTPNKTQTNTNTLLKTNKKKQAFTNIMLNKIVVLDKLCLYNRNFSPKRTKGIDRFRRSSSCLGDSNKNLGNGLAIYGSSCDIKSL
ncbi:hypothetical protein SteCoe_36340 [Stentor coeruleus]|uniref:Uncharacterized protein n=1 Tax=Stentor coeruleus TaxID=5963 RepID=A0A1R2AQA5_9CILI|nr:hypothetical protein SteCoe_36340 [Stentor coeruleus]